MRRRAGVSRSRDRTPPESRPMEPEAQWCRRVDLDFGDHRVLVGVVAAEASAIEITTMTANGSIGSGAQPGNQSACLVSPVPRKLNMRQRCAPTFTMVTQCRRGAI